MLKLSKKSEYGILAMQYLAENRSELITAKEMSDKLELSFEFLAKTLQHLKREGLLKTIQGMKGGYELNVDPKNTSLMTIISALEKHPEIVECSHDDHNNCERKEFCTIRNPMLILQKKIDQIFNETYLTEFIRNKPIELTLMK